MNTTYRNPTTSSTCLATLLASSIVITCAALSLVGELRLAVPLLIGTTAIIALALSCALYFGEQDKLAWSPKVILAVALLMRLLFLFTPPQLSDDIYRYLWDGSNTLRGINPYAAAPSTVKPAPELAHIHSRINHPDYVTIYPPMAQVLFGGGAALGGSVTGLKAFFVLIDIGLCALLILLLKMLEMPVWRSVLYAWNPLPVLEIAGSGHVDGAGLALVIAAFYLLLHERKTPRVTASRRWPFLLSGALLACAGMVKLIPFIFAPALILLAPSGKRRYFFVSCVMATVLFGTPFLPHLANINSSLNTYANNWEFAGFAFNTLRTFTGSGTIARLLLAACFLLVLGVTTYRLARKMKLTASLRIKTLQSLKTCYVIGLAFLLLTPTLQPWYALTLATFLPFCAGPAGLVLCWTVFLTYQVQIPYFILGLWIENPHVTAAVFLAPATACLMSSFLKIRRIKLNNQMRQECSDSPISLANTRANPNGKSINNGTANQVSRCHTKKIGSRQ